MVASRRSLLGWLRGVLGLCVVAGGVLACGCGDSSGLIPVAGTVSLDGRPAKAGSLQFHPNGGKGNPSLDIYSAEIVDGKYEVLTTTGKKGAAPGSYKVCVFIDNFSGGNVPPMGGTAQMPKSLIPTKYNNKETTPLSVEVKANPAPGAYDLHVKSK